MKMQTLINFLNKVIDLSFYALFLFVPLIFLPLNYELFEYNKMMLTYALTAIIVFSWLAKMVLLGKVQVARTPLDIAIAIFFIAQVVATIFSIDPHLSWWGYYSRFNGGLLSTICYILLYYAFVSNIGQNPNSKNKNILDYKNSVGCKIQRLLITIFFSATIVAIWGILEHFGHSFSCLFFTFKFDDSCWVQDVQNRVFSTLGQPNWMAAYLAILIPIAIGLALKSKSGILNSKCFDKPYKKIFAHLNLFAILSIVFYLTLLYTKSRSGFFGLWISLFVFLKTAKGVKSFFAIIFIFFVITFFIKSPVEQINRFFSFDAVKKYVLKNQVRPEKVEPLPPRQVIETGGTESWEIRKIVWEGGIKGFLARPVFGWGVETFAWVYYRFKPVQHNLVSEWDFLYNKAHNEYINYAATSGIFGLGSYLFIIFSFILWSVKNLKVQSSKFKSNLKFKAQKISLFGFWNLTLIVPLDFDLWILLLGLFSGWISILITNFVGFSVVVVSLFFWLIPAIAFALFQEHKVVVIYQPNTSLKGIITIVFAVVAIIILIALAVALLFHLLFFWIADSHFAAGLALARRGDYTQAYKEYRQAIVNNPDEPLYHDEFASTLAPLSLLALKADEASFSGELADLALAANAKALRISPNNVNFWKSRITILLTLSEKDDKYSKDAISAIESTETLAPTDPKIVYNKGLLLTRLGKKDDAVRAFTKALQLKPNYKEPRLALALLYQEQGKKTEAARELEKILSNIDPNDDEVKKLLQELLQNQNHEK